MSPGFNASALSKGRQCLLEPAAVEKKIASVEPGFGETGMKLNRAIVIGLRFGSAPQGFQHGSAAEIRFRRRRFQKPGLW